MNLITTAFCEFWQMIFYMKCEIIEIETLAWLQFVLFMTFDDFPTIYKKFICFSVMLVCYFSQDIQKENNG